MPLNHDTSSVITTIISIRIRIISHNYRRENTVQNNINKDTKRAEYKQRNSVNIRIQTVPDSPFVRICYFLCHLHFACIYKIEWWSVCSHTRGSWIWIPRASAAGQISHNDIFISALMQARGRLEDRGSYLMNLYSCQWCVYIRIWGQNINLILKIN